MLGLCTDERMLVELGLLSNVWVFRRARIILIEQLSNSVFRRAKLLLIALRISMPGSCPYAMIPPFSISSIAVVPFMGRMGREVKDTTRSHFAPEVV